MYFCMPFGENGQQENKDMKKTNRMNMMLWLALSMLAMLVSQEVQAQVTSNLSYRRYTTQDGLPQMLTETIFQDARGYIYVGTLSGFVRYDGKEFTPFLRGHHWNIVGFMETEEGVSALSFRQQWLIDDDQVKLRPLDPQGKWLLNNFNATDLPNGYVLLEDEQEEQRRLCKVTGNGFETVYNDGILDMMTPDRHLYMDSIMGILIPEGNIYSYHRQGNTLYAFGQDGIYSVENDSLHLLTPYDRWAASYGLIVRNTNDGTMLIADEHTIYSYDGKEVKPLAGGFNLIKDMLIDRWDRLWVATYQGLYCFFNRHFTNYQLTDQDDIVRAVASHLTTYPPPLLIQGTLNGKIMVGRQVVYDNPDDFFQPSAAVIDSCVYMASGTDVASVSGDGHVTWLGLPFNRYQFVAEADGRLILGLRQLIAAYDPLSGRIDTLSTEIPHPWCAAADGEGHLWVGSTFGLYRIGEQGPTAVSSPITAMDADPQGTVFFASCDSLFMIRHGNVEELNSQLLQLSGHEVRSLHVTKQGCLVVAVVDGLFVCRITSDYRLSDICFFNHLNGFTLIEPLKATMAEQADGTVWLCGVEQMTSFNPEELLRDAQADTFIAPPLRWWQHWWIWLIAVALLIMVTWALTRWIEKRRTLHKMLRLQREKHERERLIHAIREEAMKAIKVEQAEKTELAQDIVKMTDKAPTPVRLTLRTTGGMLMVDVDDIVYLKAEGNYTRLVTFHKSDLVMLGIGALAKMLEAHSFVRADRSTVVNIQYINRLLTAERRCIFQSPEGTEIETTLLSPAFKRLKELL